MSSVPTAHHNNTYMFRRVVDDIPRYFFPAYKLAIHVQRHLCCALDERNVVPRPRWHPPPIRGLHLHCVELTRNALAVRLWELLPDCRHELGLVPEEPNSDKVPVVFRPFERQDGGVAANVAEAHAESEREVMFDAEERAERCLDEAAETKIVFVIVVTARGRLSILFRTATGTDAHYAVKR